MDTIPENRVIQLLDTDSAFIANSLWKTNAAANKMTQFDPSADWLAQYLLADGSRAMTGALDMGTNLINNVVDPTTNQQAATKKYVDDNAGGSPTTTKGDLIVRGVSVDGRLPAGADDELIFYDSTQALGVRTGNFPTGSWTPEVYFGAGVGYSSYIVQGGSYIDYGDSAFITWDIIALISARTAAAGAFSIRNHPFASPSNAQPAGFILGGFFGWTGEQFAGYLTSSQLRIDSFDPSTGAFTSTTDANVSGAFQVWQGSCLYIKA